MKVNEQDINAARELYYRLDFDANDIPAIASAIAQAREEAVMLKENEASVAALETEIESMKKAAFIHSRRGLSGRFADAYTDEELTKMFGPWWFKRDTAGLDPREVRLLETVADRNLQLAQSVITCVYCGHHYKSATNDPAEHREHIKTCENHPVKELEEAVRVLAEETLHTAKRSYMEWGSAGEDVMAHVPDEVRNNDIASAAVERARKA